MFDKIMNFRIRINIDDLRIILTNIVKDIKINQKRMFKVNSIKEKEKIEV